MPAKGSGAGRIKGAPQLIARVSSDEDGRVKGYALAMGVSVSELIRLALVRFEPRLNLTVSQTTIDALVRARAL